MSENSASTDANKLLDLLATNSVTKSVTANVSPLVKPAVVTKGKISMHLLMKWEDTEDHDETFVVALVEDAIKRLVDYWEDMDVFTEKYYPSYEWVVEGLARLDFTVCEDGILKLITFAWDGDKPKRGTVRVNGLSSNDTLILIAALTKQYQHYKPYLVGRDFNVITHVTNSSTYLTTRGMKTAPNTFNKIRIVAIPNDPPQDLNPQPKEGLQFKKGDVLKEDKKVPVPPLPKILRDMVTAFNNETKSGVVVILSKSQRPPTVKGATIEHVVDIISADRSEQEAFIAKYNKTVYGKSHPNTILIEFVN